MRIDIVAIGKLKAGPDRELLERYAGRIAATGRNAGITAFDVIELPESKSADRVARMSDEADRLIVRSPKSSVKILLDERGKALTSQQFTAEIRRLRDAGESGLAFLLGGPDGHGDATRKSSRLVVSLGPMTLPHGLARIVLAEQIYRATTILTGHPYHRD